MHFCSTYILGVSCEMFLFLSADLCQLCKLQICRLILIKKNKTHTHLLVNKTTDPIFEWSLIGTLSKLCPTVLSSIKNKDSCLKDIQPSQYDF